MKLDYERVLILDEAKKRLVNAGYEQLLEREDWKLEAGKKYFFTRNYSTIIAFAIGKKYEFFTILRLGCRMSYYCGFSFLNADIVEPMLRYVAGNGFHIIGAHTDSPCLKLKPVSKVTS